MGRLDLRGEERDLNSSSPKGRVLSQRNLGETVTQGTCPYPLSQTESRCHSWERGRKGNWLCGYCSQSWPKSQYQPVF